MKPSPNASSIPRFRSGLMYAAIILGLLFYLWISLYSAGTDVRFDNEPIAELDGKWIAEYGGVSRNTSLPSDIRAGAGETVAFTTRLEKDDTYHNSIMLRSNHQYVRVLLDDELLASFGNPNTLFGKVPGNGWLIVRLPENWADRRLTVEITGNYEAYPGSLGKVYLGTKNSLVFQIIHSTLPQIIFNFSIMLISVILLIAGVFLRKRYLVSQLRYLGLFALITSLWLILESGGYQLFWGDSFLVYCLIFLLFSLIPVVFTRFLLTYESFSDSRYMNGVYLLALAAFAAFHLLQAARVLDYLESAFLIHIVIVLVIAGILFRFLQSRRDQKYKQDRFLYLSCIAFSFFAIVDILRFYLSGMGTNSVLFSQAGLFFFFLILSVSAIQKIVLERDELLRQDFFRTLAFTDLLTSLPNRNAFEKELERYRSAKPPLHPLIIVADLNNLKRINDTLGHSQGDAAIIRTGNSLKNSFTPEAKVFRIGGDEFCVISTRLTEQEAAQRMETVRKDLLDASERANPSRIKNGEPAADNAAAVPLVLSLGCYLEKGEGIDEAFTRADAEMYREKERLKQSSFHFPEGGAVGR